MGLELRSHNHICNVAPAHIHIQIKFHFTWYWSSYIYICTESVIGKITRLCSTESKMLWIIYIT